MDLSFFLCCSCACSSAFVCLDGAGKGNWGVATDPEVAPAAIDERDPNYVVCS